MGCNNCGICCLETEMLLSTKDIERLIKKGYNIEFFARYDEDGYIMLRNRNGHCVFYDVKKRKCKIYDNRPLGCRLYPIIFDESKGVIVHKLCPLYRSWTKDEKKTAGTKVIKFLKKIDSEAKQGCSS